jgi:hypothetical protein
LKQKKERRTMDKDKFMKEMDVQYKIATELIEEYHAGQVHM